jgi:hypothetical protein
MGLTLLDAEISPVVGVMGASAMFTPMLLFTALSVGSGRHLLGCFLRLEPRHQGLHLQP